MDCVILSLIGCAMMLLGLIGCFVPILPGPAIAYAALWALYLFGCSPSVTLLAIGAGLVLVVMIADYIVPSLCAKRFRCSAWGVWGCFIGSIVGLFFLPFGIILGPFLGTVVGELIAGKRISSSLRGGFGALLGYGLCLGLKLFAVGLFASWYFMNLPCHQ